MSATRICFNLERPDIADKRVQGRRGPFSPVLMSLETLIAINKWQLRQHNYPLLYTSGIYYKTIPPASEWHDIPTLLKLGYGDCKDLAAYRIAELDHYYGIKTKPLIKWKWISIPIRSREEAQVFNLEWHGIEYEQDILLIHVMVGWPDGRIEDPSKILGMGGEYT